MLNLIEMKHYHYIFAGAGLASLLTAYKMAMSGRFKKSNILLIDPDPKKSNDRTWCFWQKGAGNWDNILKRRWDTAVFANEQWRINLDFDGYAYKMVRGIDFYNSIFEELRKHPNIGFLNQKVMDVTDTAENVLVTTETESYTCNTLFNSIYNPNLPALQNKYPVLQQHFIGWHVRTDQKVFDAGKPVFMDFSIRQKGNTRFMYVLPFSENEALVEYTLFSGDLLPTEEYEDAIKEYLSDLGAASYEIIDTESGSIPMTCYPFWKNNTKNILHIGSAGGWTKASTGYTFRNADKLSARLVSFLAGHDHDMRHFHKKNRFWFYDLLLLDILAGKNHKGAGIFSAMFKKGDAAPVFKFLDEETTVAEDLKVIGQCPKGLFLKALFNRIFKT
ncbi:lycopene cyclase family protein [uncultured Flavobacterium sp.]|uniref:lycopene cyclase family protein n=1 Tax=uncultured Flavobacterium sp. TaxID=165435 RepID=UPI0025CC9DC2|nr:lycopene cyclase family protein [uncultured Flavobacterium sp.]